MNPKIFPGNQEPKYGKNKSLSGISVLAIFSDRCLDKKFILSYMALILTHTLKPYLVVKVVVLPASKAKNFLKNKTMSKHLTLVHKELMGIMHVEL